MRGRLSSRRYCRSITDWGVSSTSDVVRGGKVVHSENERPACVGVSCRDGAAADDRIM